MFRWFIIGFCFLSSCAAPSRSVNVPQATIELRESQLYIVPFETVMVPREVSEGLFDLFVDRLNRQGAAKGVEFIILKQGLAEIDPAWLADKSYARGELFAYIEEVGSSMTNIKARSRIRLYQPGRAEPTLQLAFPTEKFYQNDYSTLPAERRKLAQEIAKTLADRFLAALAGR